MAFLLPGLHSSALPDITVVITALSPRKLFTVSRGSKNGANLREEAADEGGEGKKRLERQEISDSRANEGAKV